MGSNRLHQAQGRDGPLPGNRGFLKSDPEKFWHYLADYFTMTGKLQP
jgi:hypothetical protein